MQNSLTESAGKRRMFIDPEMTALKDDWVCRHGGRRDNVGVSGEGFFSFSIRTRTSGN